MPRASLLSRLLLALGALLLALTAGELVFRWFGPPMLPTSGFILTPAGERVPSSEIYHYMVRRGNISDEGEGPRGHLQPNFEARMGYDQPMWSYYDKDGCITTKNNSLGFRDDEFLVQKPAGEFRVLALGDSFTYGMGVQAHDNWPTVLERMLQADRGGAVQVINAGMASGNGARSAAEYAPWLEREGMGFAPDMVVLGFCLNDISDGIPMLSYLPPAYQPTFFGVSRILDSLVMRARLRAARMEDRKSAIDALIDAEPKRWLQVQEGMQKLQQLCLAAKIPFVVAVFPMISQLDGQYPYGRIHEMVATFCLARGIHCVDLLPAFRGRADQSLWVHFTDQHPNDVGHQIMAEQIFTFLRAQQLLPPKAR